VVAEVILMGVYAVTQSRNSAVNFVETWCCVTLLCDITVFWSQCIELCWFVCSLQVQQIWSRCWRLLSMVQWSWLIQLVRRSALLCFGSWWKSGVCAVYVLRVIDII